MKKITSLILALIMVFSFNIYSFAVEEATTVQSSSVAKKPKAVKSISTKVTGRNYITLSFSKAKNADYYEVWVFTEEKGYFLYAETEETSATVKGLESDSVYSFRIRGVNKEGEAVSYGDYAYHYDFTLSKGLPSTNSQAAAYYNSLVNGAKNEQSLTLTVKKTVDTEAYSTTKYALLKTVKNMMNLFEGSLKKTYKFKKGKSGNATPMSVIEPVKKEASLRGEYIKSFDITEEDGKTKLSIRLKAESTAFDAEKTGTPAYHSSVMKKVNVSRLKTAPLEIDKGYSFFDGAEIYATVKEQKLTRLRIKSGVSVVADLKVSTVDFGTEVGYNTDTIFTFKYTGKGK